MVYKMLAGLGDFEL